MQLRVGDDITDAIAVENQSEYGVSWQRLKKKKTKYKAKELDWFCLVIYLNALISVFFCMNLKSVTLRQDNLGSEQKQMQGQKGQMG